MTGGTEFSEATEAPQESKDINESPERQAEIKEVAEVSRQVNEATHEPEAALEKGDIQQAEAVQEAFVSAVPPVEIVQEVETTQMPPPVKETSTEEQQTAGESGGKSAFGDQVTDPGDNYSGVDMTQGEVLEDSDLNDQNEATPEGSPEIIMDKKEELDGNEGSSDSGDDYSGVQMTQGEVAQDSDLNNPPERGDKSSVDQDQLNESAASDNIQAAADQVEGQSTTIQGAASGLTAANEALKQAQDLPKDPQESDVVKKEVKTDTGADDFVQDMAGSKPGEVRGFVNDQENNSYILEASGDAGENGENQIVIPSGNSQIDFSGIVGEVQKTNPFVAALGVAKDEVGDFRVPSLHQAEIDSLPGRDPSGDYLKTPGDAADLEVTQQEDPPAYDPDLKPEKTGSEGENADAPLNVEYSEFPESTTTDSVPADTGSIVQEAMRESYLDQNENLEFFADKLHDINEMKGSIREEMSMLSYEFSDWPDDGSTREITVTTWEEGKDGTYVKVEKTVTLTKEEAEDLLNTMEDGLDGSDSRGSSDGTESEYSYQLVEGSLLVGESDVNEATGGDGEEDEEEEIIQV